MHFLKRGAGDQGKGPARPGSFQRFRIELLRVGARPLTGFDNRGVSRHIRFNQSSEATLHGERIRIAQNEAAIRTHCFKQVIYAFAKAPMTRGALFGPIFDVRISFNRGCCLA